MAVAVRFAAKPLGLIAKLPQISRCESGFAFRWSVSNRVWLVANDQPVDQDETKDGHNHMHVVLALA